jgi:putative AEC family transporter
MMLSLGMSLAASRLRAPSGEGAPAPPPEPVHNAADRAALRWALGWKLLVLPGIAALGGFGLGLRGPDLLVPVTTACLPTAQNVFMYASRYGVAKPLARDAVLLTTVGFAPIILIAAAVLG